MQAWRMPGVLTAASHIILPCSPSHILPYHFNALNSETLWLGLSTCSLPSPRGPKNFTQFFQIAGGGGGLHL